MRLGFRGRLVLGVTTLVVAFAGAAVSVLSVLTGQFVARQAQRQVEECRDGFRRQMENRLAAWRSSTEAMARTPLLLAMAAIPDVDEKTAADCLDDLRAPLVVVLDTNGRVLASRGCWPPGSDLHAMPGVAEGLAGTDSDRAWKLGKGLALVAVARLEQGDRVLGLLVRGERVDDTLAASIGAIAGRDVLFLRDGNLLGASWRGPRPQHTDFTSLRHLRHDGVPISGLTATPTVDNLPRDGLAVRLHADAGVAWLSHDLQEVHALRRQAYAWLLLAGAILALLGIAFAARIAERLSRPLRRLTNTSDRMGRGDLATRVDDAGLDAEFRQLAQSFNAMAATVQTLVREVTDKAARAEAGNRAKDAFLTSMSHELRTPLTGIQSTAALLQQFGDEASPAERAEFLDTILRESERLGQRISSALEFASLAGGRVRWTVGRVSLLALCEQACRRLACLLPLKHVDLQVVCAPDAMLQGDREHLTQAVYHLLHNAWTWSPTEGAVEVTVRDVPGGFVIEVADRGPGIPAHERQRVFDSFSQGGDVLVDKPAGIGIGLKIAAEIAAMHGGAIDYDDRPGGGACFRMLLRCEDRPIDRVVASAAETATAD
ncbi:MAG: HAMP domain-containing histidine kinase [Planctomycetes bacterium]|nr:HAMP domain-containing histidine kinase [Planctomycetota bacterium]